MRADAAFRAAGDIPRRWPFVAGTAKTAPTAVGFFGGLPRRRIGPCRASMAWFSRSRSWMRAASISGIGIRRQD